MEGLGKFLAEWQAEHGAFTESRTATRLKDAIEASAALLADPGDRLYTSDAGDLRALCGAAGNEAAGVGC